jgi:hypothetical protein
MPTSDDELFNSVLDHLRQIQGLTQVTASELSLITVTLRNRILDRVRQARADLRRNRNPDDWRRILTTLWSDKDITLLGSSLPPLPADLPDLEPAEQALKAMEALAQETQPAIPRNPAPAAAGPGAAAPARGADKG